MALVIRKRPGEDIEHLIRRFQKRVFEEGIIREFREKERYKKPSQIRKEKRYRRERELRKLKARPYF